ncbi:hypothetical protein VSR01_16485 [Actinacidiphila sp. DG2A-62]|uniref:hypothetical protein n=1 Tax=Actinacidiphila sp. DG2A-62 TaxID=3108821 RepID=UPI002DB6BB5F|nr:hypothetical protein [Actinacidiphila sp. DG2A-62]MEC3995044.1 hypothetical protein [Actinacidiphila sp. DG2A-62]
MPSYCSPTSRAHNLLVRGLADRHGLGLLEAHFAVRRAALGIPDEHTELVHAEAHALLLEFTTAVNHHLATLARAFATLGQAATRAAASMQAAPRPSPERPAWQSPHGPARTRRGSSR